MADIDIRTIDQAILSALTQCGIPNARYVVVIEDRPTKSAVIGSNVPETGGAQDMLARAIYVIERADEENCVPDRIGEPQGSA